MANGSGVMKRQQGAHVGWEVMKRYRDTHDGWDETGIGSKRSAYTPKETSALERQKSCAEIRKLLRLKMLKMRLPAHL